MQLSAFGYLRIVDFVTGWRRVLWKMSGHDEPLDRLTATIVDYEQVGVLQVLVVRQGLGAQVDAVEAIVRCYRDRHRHYCIHSHAVT